MSQTKTILITGAAGGIGRATVSLFAEKGWRVIGVDRAEFGGEFPASGLFIQSDISRPEDMKAIFDRAHAFTDSLDALVNNAAVQVAKPLVQTTVEEWDAVMAANLRSVFLGVKLAHPLLKVRGGAVVNVSSVHAIQTSTNIAAATFPDAEALSFLAGFKSTTAVAAALDIDWWAFAQLIKPATN